jgi:diphthine-ammonia ligase
MTIEDLHFFSSWSGGKDSCLALHKAIQLGGRPRRLLTMLEESGIRSRSHGLPTAVLSAQATSMGIPIETMPTTWDDYEENFLTALGRFGRDGVEAGVFGDIDLEAHREWTERVCASAGLKAYSPLWKMARRDVLDMLIQAGFKAMIVSLKEDALDGSFLGRYLTRETVEDLEEAGVDACGEEGEYHTVVLDGPLFSKPVRVARGGISSHGGYSFLELTVGD